MGALHAAVIGVGHLGRHHARLYAEMKGVTLVAVVDPDERRGKEVGVNTGARWFASLDQLMDSGLPVDLASVVVPTVEHHAVARKLLQKGIHLLIEKPVTAETWQAQELIALAKEKGCIVAVGHVEQFNPPMEALRQLTPSPLMIRTRREGLYTGRIADVGVVLDLMIHDLELVRSLVKSPLKSITARCACFHHNGHEDLAQALLVFEDGTLAELFCSRVSHHKSRVLELISKDCTWELDLGNCSLLEWRAQHDPVTGVQAGASRVLPLEATEPLKAELEHFVRCVCTKSRPLVSLEDGAEALRWALEVLRVCK